MWCGILSNVLRKANKVYAVKMARSLNRLWAKLPPTKTSSYELAQRRVACGVASDVSELYVELTPEQRANIEKLTSQANARKRVPPLWLQIKIGRIELP